MKLVNIHKQYKVMGEVNIIFNNLNLTIDCENFGIIGRNGIGKSTLLRIMAGIEEADAGNVMRCKRLSWPIGFSGALSSSLTAQENCRFVARIYNQNIENIQKFVIDFSELGKYFHMPLKTYSSGMKARLAFALSMALDFDTYLVDEVIAVGDINFQKKCVEVFNSRRKKSNLIIVSHSLETLRKYCSKFGVIYDGIIETFNELDEAVNFYKGKNA